MNTFYEFFSGGGMARAGLGAAWKCLFANDFDHKKCDTYRLNWGAGEVVACDVRKIKPSDLPARANLIWGSFPCQDLSLAGAGAGLQGDRSGTFWPFWDVVKGLIADNRAPEIIALENVTGTLNSHNGKDFTAICASFKDAGYRFGAIIVDAAHFLPHSRPRLFVIGIRSDLQLPQKLYRDIPSSIWHTKTLCGAVDNLSTDLRKDWIWWDMPVPQPRVSSFADLVDENPSSVKWHSQEETKQLLSMMSDVHLAKVKAAKKISNDTGRRLVGAIYKRTRRDENGCKVQRAEVRFDDLAGCLRTPSGGSSRQLIIVVGGGKIRSRLICSRETARLMGLPDNYILPENYNEAYHLTGDGVAVPVVRYITTNIFSPILKSQKQKGIKVAA
jgi:DNA (cytosine-5)-methyltransferase 1